LSASSFFELDADLAVGSGDGTATGKKKMKI
jgi:hypothetical protein